MSENENATLPKDSNSTSDEKSTTEPSEKEAEEVKVTSANDWENADLGDKARKDKFLKLMGATKDEHKGKIVIGDHATKHKGDNPEEMNKNLEEQFQHGLERKLKSGYKSHTGLGFTKEDEKAGTDSPNPATEVDATPDTDVVEERRRVTDDNSTTDKEKSTENAGDKRTPNTEGGDAAVPKKKPMMNFVKASDS